MTRRMIHVIEGVASVVLALAGIVGVFLWYVNSNDYRTEVIAALRETTGLTATIDGPIRFTLRPIPTVVALGVHIANPPWAERPDLARFARVEAGFAPASLVLGRPHVARLKLVEGNIDLEIDRRGRRNWWWTPDEAALTQPAAQGGGAGVPVVSEREVFGSNLDLAPFPPAAPPLPDPVPVWAPDIRRLMLEQVRVGFSDARSGRATSVTVTKGTLTLPYDGPLTAKGETEYLGVPVTVTALTGGRLYDWLADRPEWPLQATVTARGTTLELHGTIDHPQSLRRLDLTTRLAGERLSALDPLLGIWLPPLGPYNATTRLSGGEGGRYELADLKGQFGKSDFAGTLSLLWLAPRPRLDGHLTASVVRTADFADASLPPPLPANDGRVFSDWPYPFDSLGSIDGRLRLEIERLVTWPGDLTRLETTALIDGRRLVLEPFHANLTGGRLDGRLAIDAGPRPTLVRWDGRATGLDLERLLPAFGWVEPPTGALDVTAALEGRGESVRRLFATADGRVDFLVGSGTLPIRGFDLIAADLIQAMVPWARHGDRTQLNCVVARFDLHQGAASSTGLLVDTSRITVAGTGGVNLASERLNLMFYPRPKDPSLISLATPMRVSGTLWQHTAAPDAVGLAARGAAGLVVGVINPVMGLMLPFINMGTGVANPCASALQVPGSLQKPADTGPFDAAVGVVRNLGQSVFQSLWGRL